MSPTRIASIPASAIAVAGVAADEQRRDRGEDQRRDRGVRAEHEHARRTEEGVADQAGDRRVEAGDRGQARRARRTPCPAARGSRRARRRRRGRSAATGAGSCGPPGPPAPSARFVRRARPPRAGSASAARSRSQSSGSASPEAAFGFAGGMARAWVISVPVLQGPHHPLLPAGGPLHPGAAGHELLDGQLEHVAVGAQHRTIGDLGEQLEERLDRTPSARTSVASTSRPCPCGDRLHRLHAAGVGAREHGCLVAWHEPTGQDLGLAATLGAQRAQPVVSALPAAARLAVAYQVDHSLPLPPLEERDQVDRQSHRSGTVRHAMARPRSAATPRRFLPTLIGPTVATSRPPWAPGRLRCRHSWKGSTPTDPWRDGRPVRDIRHAGAQPVRPCRQGASSLAGSRLAARSGTTACRRPPPAP